MRFLLVSLLVTSLSLEASLKSVNSQGWYKTDYTIAEGDNNRKVRGKDTPPWLASIGKIKRDNGTHCSSVLLKGSSENKFVLSLAQCVEGVDSVPITFLDNNMEEINRIAKKTTSQGRFWYNEWVILLLNEPITKERVPGITPKLSVGKETLTNYRHIIAGFSDDNSEFSDKVTFDDGCSVEGNKSIPSWYQLVSCYAYPGAQGGAHVGVDSSGEAFLLGVVSAIKPDSNYSIRTNIIDFSIINE